VDRALDEGQKEKRESGANLTQRMKNECEASARGTEGKRRKGKRKEANDNDFYPISRGVIFPLLCFRAPLDFATVVWIRWTCERASVCVCVESSLSTPITCRK
jgi:hypothetical protein